MHGEDIFNVHTVLNKRYSNMLGGPEYLVKWSNIPWGQHSDMSWEPYYKLIDDHTIDASQIDGVGCL